MSSSAETTRLHSLISRLCDGDLTSQEVSELTALLEGSEESINEYLALTSLHMDLSERLRASRPDDPSGIDLESSAYGSHRPVHLALLDGLTRNHSWKRLVVLTVAASLLLASAFLLSRDDQRASFAARITQKIDCDWGEQRWGTPQSAILNIGREIKLDTGLMVLEFGNGAQVTLEAPVRFTILAMDRGELNFGRLVATVPERGHGFTIQMPSMEAIDLGTQFGASVSASGTCETHVFEGSVLVRGNPGEQSQQDWRLAAGAALRIEAHSNAIQEFAANPESFLQLFDFADALPAQDGTAPIVTSGDDLVLWLDAARRLQFDERGKVVGWGDITLDDNSIEDNAWQVKAERRPQWVRHSIGERPAIRFDGTTSLVTTPMQFGDEVSIVCVIQGRSDDLSAMESGHIFNSNGPPTLILELTGNNEITGKLISSLGNEPPGPGVSLKSPVPVGAPVVAAYVYSKSANRSSLFVNGESVGDSHALSVISNRSPKFIGASNLLGDHFVGDISEILVFNSMLSPEHCSQLSADLMQKYGIAEVNREPQILSRPPRDEP